MVNMQNISGFAVPLGALKTEESPVIGEYTSLVQAGEFAKKCGFSVIQLLPVLDSGTQSSPYSSLSAFALHPIYINLSRIRGFDYCLQNDKSFKKAYNALLKHKNDARFDYEAVLNAKERLLKKNWNALIHSCACTPDSGTPLQALKKNFDNFIESKPWLKSYCVFKALKSKYAQASSQTWDKRDRNLTKDEIEKRWNDKRLLTKHLFYAFEQYLAFKQFKESSETLRSMGITLKGDLPILLNDDSCDVWATPELFNQKLRAGSPPDGDNPTGQNWGFPVYNWAAQKKDNYAWWKLRLSECSLFFGAYRLDHIPGFFRLWAMPAGERTAEMGRTEPHSTITRISLMNANFTKERIKWLSEPHIPTEVIFRIIGSLEKSHEILGLFCTRIGFEELWNFKPEIKSTADIESVNLSSLELDEEIQHEITALMVGWWKNRALIEIEKGKFVPYHKYGESSAWNSLNADEKATLSQMFGTLAKKQSKLWKMQAESIFKELVPHTDMVPCGEDLGVFIDCMPKTLEKFGILSLKVIRWCRAWFSEGQPFDDVKKYKKLSLVTTSVHDSSTLRQWWDTEKDSAKAFEKAFLAKKTRKQTAPHDEPLLEHLYVSDFTPEIAEKVLSACAKTNGAWFVPPIQDWLYLDAEKKSPCWSENAKDERVNIPGTVSRFNWTYRIPLTIEKLMEKDELIEKINRIVKIHDKK